MTGPTPFPWQQPFDPAAGAPAPPPAYGPPSAPPPAGYGYPPPAGYAPPGWHGAPWGDGPPGELRPTGKAIALFVVTLGIYGYVYTYKVHDEMKRHSGRGVGGGVALLLMLVAGIAMPFVTSAEVGSLYTRKSQPEPVRGWTGMWVLGPLLGGYVAFFAVLLAFAATSPPAPDNNAPVVFGIAFVVYLAAVAAGMAVWFVKTNDALNRYWASVGAQPEAR